MDVLVTALDDQEVAILDASVEVHTVRVEVLLQVLYQNVRLLRLQATAGVVLQQRTIEADEVAAQGQVIVGQGHPDAGSLQGAAALVDLVLVVAQDAAVGHLAARVEADGHGLQHAAPAVAGQEVEVRRVGILQEGFSSKGFDGPVGHAVAEYNEMLHSLLIGWPRIT